MTEQKALQYARQEFKLYHHKVAREGMFQYSKAREFWRIVVKALEEYNNKSKSLKQS